MRAITYAVLSAWLCLAATGRPLQPNILLILADDLGYADLSVQGCTQFQTPHIDSIAENGVRFRQAYVSNSVCAPSRAGLLSGRIGIGFEANLPDDPELGLDPRLDTMADMLKRAGYATSCIGKWHLGRGDRYYPTRRGFDHFCGLRGGSRSYLYDETQSDAPGSPDGIEIDGTQVAFEGYLTDYLTDRAIERIETHTEQAPDTPFFMFLSYTAPHAPMQAKPELIEQFAHLQNPKRRVYAAMVLSLDQGVGKVLEVLERKGLRDNTLVVFLSDNGGPLFKNGSSNGPLRDRKGSVWEGGVRVPFMLQWPGRIPSGQVRDDVISSLDLLPTFAAVAGVEPVAQASGLNLMPYLGGDGKTLGDRVLHWRRDHMTDCALRSGRYKWVENRVRNEVWLTDLEDDIGEKVNLARQYPEIVANLRAAYVAWEGTAPEPAFKSGWTPEQAARDRREEEAYQRSP